MPQQNPRIENWHVHWCIDAFLCGRVLVPVHILGQVYNHPKHKDGALVVTELVVMFDGKAGLARDTTTTYTLGAPHSALPKVLAKYAHRSIADIYFDKQAKAA
jgi:hypothetical protein